ncbi:MAG TPA: PHP-associated domain-containing protein [Bryobacteraceae bacterium]
MTAILPSGTELHAGAYSIAEHDHLELQPRRTDTESLLAYATQNRIFLTLDHAFSGLTGIEAINGHILNAGTRRAVDPAVRHRKRMIGSSDSHTSSGLGRTFTVVQGARNAYDYVAALRLGPSIPCSGSGSLLEADANDFQHRMVHGAHKPENRGVEPALRFRAAVCGSEFSPRTVFRLEPEGKLLSLEVAAL